MHQHVLAATWIANHWSDVASIVSIVIAFVAAFRPEIHSLLRPTLGVFDTLNNEHARSLITKMRVRLRASVCKQLDPNTFPNSTFSKITIQA